MTTRTYRGATIAELLPQIRAELGADAVIVHQREGLAGGIGGFFQRACVELEAAPASAVAPSLIDVHDEDGPALPGAPERQADYGDADAEPARTPADARLARFAEQMETTPAPAAPAFRPTISPQVSAVPDASPVRWPGDDNAFEPGVFGEAAAAPRDPAPYLPAPPMPGAVEARIACTSAAWPAEAHDTLDAMADAGLGVELSTEVVTHALTDLAPFAADLALRPLIAQALAQRIPVARLHAATGRVIAFVGPGGSGKTRCVAAIATAYATRSDMPVACVTLRARDDGAELQRELAPTGVPVHGARDAASARAQIDALRTHSLVLVDTPGVSPRATVEMRALARDLEELRLDEVHLTLPATTGSVAARELVTGTAPLGVTALALTHADETATIGPSVGIAVETHLPLSFISRGRIAGSALRPADAHELALAVIT